ncbi:ribonuclease R [Deinococcus sp. Marseille-Q6407]|uniref:ribonuclease R n=1 Tax=Deinococcus sp. Marseille-Q6407 TaxID=2969223 RepID=UPI0021C1CE17|nr:ribonuclease R [Deinococcus sp. Marseille-Q6407]
MPKTNPKSAPSEDQISPEAGTEQTPESSREAAVTEQGAADQPAAKPAAKKAGRKPAAKKAASDPAADAQAEQPAAKKSAGKSKSAPKTKRTSRKAGSDADAAVPTVTDPAAEATGAAAQVAETQTAEAQPETPNTAAEPAKQPRRTSRGRKAAAPEAEATANADQAEKPAGRKTGRTSRRKAAEPLSEPAPEQTAAADAAEAQAQPANTEPAPTETAKKPARRQTRRSTAKSAQAAEETANAAHTAAEEKPAEAEAAQPAPATQPKPQRKSRSGRTKKATQDAPDTAAPTLTVAADAEAQQPLTDSARVAAEVDAGSAAAPAEAAQPAPAAPRKSRRGRSSRAATPTEAAPEAEPAPKALEAGATDPTSAPASEPEVSAPAPVQEVAAQEAPAQDEGAQEEEPLVLQRPKGRSQGQRHADHAETPEPELVEKLSGVELVAPQGETGTAPQEQSGQDAGGQSDVLAGVLPELPPLPETAAPVTAEGPQLDDPVQELLVSQLRSIGRPIHVRDLEKSFTRQKARLVGGWRDIEGVLEQLTRAGIVVRTRKKTYGLPEAMNLVRGRFQASAAGFGFVVPDTGRDDYYVPPEDTLEAWNGDTVLVRPEGHGARGSNSGRRGSRFDGNPQASVVRIVQRHYSQLVGTLEYSHGYPILKADDFRARHRILLVSDGTEELETGARVVVDLYWPEDTGEDEVFGAISRVLGEEDDPETETEAVMVKYGLRGEFPPEVLSEAGRIPNAVPPEALRGRMDLRDLNTFTVDGRDAKDFDDAIHIQPTEQGTFLVGVHIADVSHYVQAGSELDGEAYARATSVYLPGRVLPMLPEHLSNGVCSLVPNEDRLTMSALVELSGEGEILNVEIGPSVIHSKARLTYDEVQAYSEATSPLPEQARQLEGDLHLLLKITSKLRQARLREGSLDFKMREVKVDVDEQGRMELIPLREETARGMIEDLMLLANKVVAHFLIERNVPALFRIHEEPTLQRFQDVTQAIGRLGLSFPGGEPTPQAYQDVLKQVRGTPRESVVNTLLLRSMQQAKYAGENLGHFGLAFDEYLHFTSPIRRYPDLLVHRVLRGVLSGVLSGELRSGSREVAQLRSVLPAMGEHTSDRERNAAEAERDLTKYYQAKWAQEHEGASFMGNVSGVVASGLFVALENGVEGKLHISHLDDDYYIYLEDAQMLKGRSNGRIFRLGDPVAVTISEVKPLARQIDFTVPEEGTELEEIVMSENQPSGNKTQTTGQKVEGQRVRARRREDREQERQQKLSGVRPSQPRFTLDEDSSGRSGQAAGQNQAQSQGQDQGRGGRQNGRSAEGNRGQGGRSNRDGSGRENGGRDAGRPRSGGQGGGNGRRRVITLERPRNEHLRPVNVTVQRMYFGDWSVDNMPEDDGGSSSYGGRPPRGGQGQRSGGRSAAGGRDSRQTAGARSRGSEGNHAGQNGGQSGEGDRRRRRRRSRRPGSETQQG